jgi:hypothetical protein
VQYKPVRRKRNQKPRRKKSTTNVITSVTHSNPQVPLSISSLIATMTDYWTPKPWFPVDTFISYFKYHPLHRPEEYTLVFHGAHIQDPVGQGANIYSVMSKGRVLYTTQPGIAVELAIKDLCLWSDEDIDTMRADLRLKLFLHSKH